MFAFSGCQVEQDSLDEGLLFHLPLNGGLVQDESGLNRVVELSGATPGEGEYADSFKFDGVDDFIRVEDFDYGPHFTVSFWFNSSNNEGTQYQYMLSHGRIHQPNSASYYFVEDDNPLTGGEIKANLRDENDEDRAEILNAPKGLSDGQWHLYTISVAAEGATVYVDGKKIVSADQGGDPINPRGDILIGSRSDRLPERFYDGYLDDIRLYDRALSAGEVEALHGLGR